MIDFKGNAEFMDAAVPSVIAQLKRILEQEFAEDLNSVWLFGSRARGDHHRWSDIDLAVVLEGVATWSEAAAKRQRVLAQVAELALQTDTVPSLRMIPRRIFQSEKSGLVGAIKREGRKL